MTILLDIDGVMETTPPWRRPELAEDGFMCFNKRAATNLSLLLTATGAHVVLSSTHRVNFSIGTWKQIFYARGIDVNVISKIDSQISLDHKKTRAEELLKWINNPDSDNNYVIIDDDSSIHALPESIKEHWVKTNTLIGFDDSCRIKAMNILLGKI